MQGSVSQPACFGTSYACLVTPRHIKCHVLSSHLLADNLQAPAASRRAAGDALPLGDARLGSLLGGSRCCRCCCWALTRGILRACGHCTCQHTICLIDRFWVSQWGLWCVQCCRLLADRTSLVTPQQRRSVQCCTGLCMQALCKLYASRQVQRDLSAPEAGCIAKEG